MNVAARRRWIYVRAGGTERLFHASLNASAGRLRLPEIGTAAYDTRKGGRAVWGLRVAADLVRDFSDGDVLVRTKTGGLRMCGRESKVWGLALSGVLASASVFCSMRVQTTESHAAPKRRSVIATPTAVPTVEPSSTRTPRPAVPRAGPSRRSVSVPLSSRAAELEVHARREFLRGDLSQAAYHAAEARAAAGKNGKSPAALYAEVEYAICRRAAEMKEWETAATHCAAAAGVSSDGRTRKLLAQLASRTRRLYLEGYVMEGINPEASAGRYREALRSAVRGDRYGEKAERKLRLMKRAKHR